MDLKCSKGDRIILRDNCSQTFEGTVKSVNEKLGRLLLSDVVLQKPERRTLEGYRHFDRNDIEEFKVVQVGEINFELSESSCNVIDHAIDEIYENGKNEKSLIKLNEKLGNEFCYIKNLGRNFHVAISLLKKSTIVGLCAENVSKGRQKRASLIALSTKSHSFIFDLLVLGDKAFHGGLKEILESSQIIKVVCDCRFLSDCLKHKHMVDLVNVRDVEAEDIMVLHQQRKIIRHHSRSLNYLVKMYLGSNLETCKVSYEEWDKRPLQQNLLKFLTSSVSILVPLHAKIQKIYLQRLISASDIYNNYLKNSSIFEFVQTDVEHTIKKQMIQLVSPNNEPRANNFKMPKNKC